MRTRDTAKANEDKDIEALLRILNDTENTFGMKIKGEFYKSFNKRLIAARRSDPDKKGKKVGGRSVHYDFQIQTEDGWFNVEHKGSQMYSPIDPSLPPWTGGVQFYNGGMEKYHFAKKYAEEWYKMWIGSGILKERYAIEAPIPTLEDWIKKDAKVQGDPGTAFGKELKLKYRALHNGGKVSLTAERDLFVVDFLTKCTQDDCELLKQDIMPLLTETLSQKHYWLQIAGNLETGIFHCAWTKELQVNSIKNIQIVLQSDIWINVECENDFKFRGILRFGKGSGFSNIRLDLRD